MSNLWADTVRSRDGTDVTKLAVSPDTEDNSTRIPDTAWVRTVVPTIIASETSDLADKTADETITGNWDHTGDLQKDGSDVLTVDSKRFIQNFVDVETATYTIPDSGYLVNAKRVTASSDITLTLPTPTGKEKEIITVTCAEEDATGTGYGFFLTGHFNGNNQTGTQLASDNVRMATTLVSDGITWWQMDSR